MNHICTHTTPARAAYAYPRPKEQKRPAEIHVGKETRDRNTADFSPPVDIVRSGGELLITAEVAGADRDSLSATVRDGDLVIEGHKPPLDPAGHGTGFGPERQSGRFRERIPLPNEADIQEIDGAYERGILSVTVPLNDGEDSATIPIHKS